MSKEKFCRNCGQKVDKKALVCTSCGVKLKKPLFKKWWIWVIVAVIITAIGISNNTKNNTDKDINTTVTENSGTDTPKKKTDTQKRKNSPKISKAEFEALETGITYEEAVSIIGGEGELISQADAGGYDTKIYTWDGEGHIGSNANATFQNNALISKAQLGLE